MKKHLLLLLTLVCVCLTSSCKDEDEAAPDSVYMYSTTGTVDAAAGTHSVTIFTTCAWTAAGDTWITVNPVAGGEKGIHVVKLSYTASRPAYRNRHVQGRNLYGDLHADTETVTVRRQHKPQHARLP